MVIRLMMEDYNKPNERAISMRRIFIIMLL